MMDMAMIPNSKTSDKEESPKNTVQKEIEDLGF